MKLIIDISEEVYKASKIVDARYEYTVQLPFEIIKNGTPLDNVKAEIANLSTYMFEVYELKSRVLHILDNIGKADMNVKCNTCKNNDDELSGECYECIKGIFDHYEPQEADFPQAKDIEPTVKGFIDTMDILDRMCEDKE